MSGGRPRRPAGRSGGGSPRRRGPRKVTLALAALLAVLALVAGLVLGALLTPDDDPAPLQTVEREVPVVTVAPGR